MPQVVHAEAIRESFTIEFTVPDANAPVASDFPSLDFGQIDLATLIHQTVNLPLAKPETLQVQAAPDTSWTLAVAFSQVQDSSGQPLTDAQLTLSGPEFSASLSPQTPIDLWSGVGAKTTRLTAQTQLQLSQNVWATAGIYTARMTWQLKMIPHPDAKNLTPEQNYSILEVTKED
ncbi:hypothetical protein FC34_GL001237 [Lacticaseibacillus brantae DSM 23927]|uniref:WxL domain-containing protein n=2 Tax=Lacticaseibacillus brantae TaxID=943673 RepID=A0A0R2B9C7_9LACO|nr:hypothetical protein FC34_GL001237 [Lacticaseibacillus brantae DSM 23927]